MSDCEQARRAESARAAAEAVRRTRASSISSPTAHAPALRVGIALDAASMPAWQAKVVGDLRVVPYASVVLVVIGQGAGPYKPRGRMSWPGARHGLFALYQHIDRRLYRADPDALATVAVSARLAGITTVTAADGAIDATGAASRLTDAVRRADLDVLVDLGRRPLTEGIHELPRYGVWSYRCGGQMLAGSAGFFRAMRDGDPVSSTSLTVRSSRAEGERTLYRSFSPTDPVSLTLTSNAALWKTAEFVSRRLKDLHGRGWSYIESLPDYAESLTVVTPDTVVLTDSQMVRFAARVLSNMVMRRARRWVFGRELWCVAARRAAPGTQIDPGAGVIDRTRAKGERFHLVLAPEGRYFADPFVVEHDGAHHMFVEDYVCARGRAVISSSRIGGGGRPGPWQVVLERDYHLSYPFVFQWNDVWYMVPETGANRTVELYRAEPFPERWTLERVLLEDLFAVDSTLLEHEGVWWLFANVAVPGASINEELCLFYSDSPLGRWHPHPMNPVVSDVRRARPAGRIFSHDGMLIRPSQDCSTRYGAATVFNHVTLLGRDEYQEVPIGRLGPEWMRGNLATHTYNATRTYEVRDAIRRQGIRYRARGTVTRR